uniref:AH domain-containing protein n=1 Tax=Romanomermis culicivorax TaxID=13658 RepID=A0A915HLM0_ROMCU
MLSETLDSRPQHPGLIDTDGDFGNQNSFHPPPQHGSRSFRNSAIHSPTADSDSRNKLDSNHDALASSFSKDHSLNVCVSSSGFSLAQSKLDSLKTWGILTYKCTRQALQEKLGKTNRTVDVELEQSIDALKDVQSRYNNILSTARSMAAHFSNMLISQKQLSDCFFEMCSKEIDLKEEFARNAETQKIIAKNGERLLSALNFFVSSLATLCDKTIEDTILTIKAFEIARLEYDANRNDLEQLQQTHNRSPDYQHALRQNEVTCQQYKAKYEQLRDDVQVKMKFLHENKVKVLQKQLLLLHNATTAFFTGNQLNLESSLKQFSVKTSNSWLEG